jgi:ribosomal protein L11 methyltransferase
VHFIPLQHLHYYSPTAENPLNPKPTHTHPFRILAPGETAVGRYDLLLERSAFGGGTHPTTVSCLDLLAEIAPLEGVRLLDLGSGTAILGIAALRLGADHATCVDVNPDAVASAQRNGVANGLADRLDHRCATADDLAGSTFDLVVANIGGELLLDEAPRIAPLARPGGRLLLSGLLRDHADELATAYAAHGCRVLQRRFPAPFCTLLLQRG